MGRDLHPPKKMFDLLRLCS